MAKKEEIENMAGSERLKALQAAMEKIEKNYSDQYKQSNYFAAVSKKALYSLVIADKETGSFTIG